MRQIFLWLCVIFTAAAHADTLHCPELTEISRVDGEYAWQTTNPLWEGYFAFPKVGIGQSSTVVSFLDARWVQLTDLKNAPGVVECDYAGNAPGEVIRFVLLNAQSSLKPHEYSWSCSFAPPFPSTQCSCGGQPSQCNFEKS